MSEVMNQGNFFSVLALLWGQESMKNSTTPELRAENVTFMKSIGMSFSLPRDQGLTASTAKMFENEKLQAILDTIDPLLADGDRYKQRSGAELLAGLSRGMLRATTCSATFILPQVRSTGLSNTRTTCGHGLRLDLIEFTPR